MIRPWMVFGRSDSELFLCFAFSLIILLSLHSIHSPQQACDFWFRNIFVVWILSLFFIRDVLCAWCVSYENVLLHSETRLWLCKCNQYVYSMPKFISTWMLIKFEWNYARISMLISWAQNVWFDLRLCVAFWARTKHIFLYDHEELHISCVRHCECVVQTHC